MHKRLWGCWFFCVIATVLVLSLVFTSTLHSMNDHMRPGQLRFGPFAFLILRIKNLFIVKVLKCLNTVFSWIGLWNKQKTPKEKAAYRISEISVLKLVCDIRFDSTATSKRPQWPCWRLWSRVDLSAGRLIPVNTAQKARLACTFAWSVLLPGHFPTVLGALIKAVNHKSLRHMSMKPLQCHWG